MARLAAGASGASAQGLMEAGRCRPDRSISKGSAARRRFHFFLVLPLRLRSPCRFVRRCHASSGVGCRMCRCRTCALRPSLCPRDSRATALGSSEISSCSAAVLPVVRFVAVPVRAGAAGRIRPADCARRSLPNQGCRQCAADASERASPPGAGGRFAASVVVRNVFPPRFRASAPTIGRATGKKPSDRRKRGNNGGPTGKSARRMRFFQRGSCSKRKKIVFLFVKTDVIPRRKC